MSSTGAGYDYGTGSYSPDGRVFQVEYAQKAVDNSGTVIAVRCTDGVVMGVEKLLISKMLVAGTGRRLHTIDIHRFQPLLLGFVLQRESITSDINARLAVLGKARHLGRFCSDLVESVSRLCNPVDIQRRHHLP